MIAAGLSIPIPVEHQADARPLTPSEKAADRLRNNSGWIEDYEIRDGNLWALHDIRDESISKKLDTTIKFVSPWVSSFTDGSGRKWEDVIGHVALTTRPRIAKQKPFSWSRRRCRWPPSTGPDPTRWRNGISLSPAGLLVRKDGKLTPKTPMALAVQRGGPRPGGDEASGEEERAARRKPSRWARSPKRSRPKCRT